MAVPSAGRSGSRTKTNTDLAGRTFESGHEDHRPLASFRRVYREQRHPVLVSSIFSLAEMKVGQACSEIRCGAVLQQLVEFLQMLESSRAVVLIGKPRPVSRALEDELEDGHRCHVGAGVV